MKVFIQKAVIVLLVMCITRECWGQVAQDLTLIVRDENGDPLTGANAEIAFRSVTNKEVVHSGLTDDFGRFSARSEQTIDVRLRASMADRYRALVRDSDYYKVPIGKATIPVVLPRILQPTALHALRVILNLPVENEWIGYDFQVGDFVLPFGKGKIVDIRFKYRKEFMGYQVEDSELEKIRERGRARALRGGRRFTEEDLKRSAGRWRGSLEIGFPGEQEGVITEAERYWFYGQLRLPHLAPLEGYQPSLRFENTTYLPRADPRRVGFFLRTRVVLDGDGDIVSANYGKIYDDIRFDPRGTVSFWYYFNPTPNDRNLEFDTSRNLFPSRREGTNIGNP